MKRINLGTPHLIHKLDNLLSNEGIHLSDPKKTRFYIFTYLELNSVGIIASLIRNNMQQNIT